MAAAKKRVEEMLKEMSRWLCKGSWGERKEVVEVTEALTQRNTDRKPESQSK